MPEPTISTSLAVQGSWLRSLANAGVMPGTARRSTARAAEALNIRMPAGRGRTGEVEQADVESLATAADGVGEAGRALERIRRGRVEPELGSARHRIDRRSRRRRVRPDRGGGSLFQRHDLEMIEGDGAGSRA